MPHLRVQLAEIANAIDKPNLFIIFDNDERRKADRTWYEQVSQQLIERLTKALPNSPKDKWQTLWQAGMDDDTWHDAYYPVIAQSGRLFLSQHPQLLPLLLNQYAHALAQDSWEERRILLAILAACLETMPQTIQNLCDEQGFNLEQLLIQGTKDYDSFSSRRFALAICAV